MGIGVRTARGNIRYKCGIYQREKNTSTTLHKIYYVYCI